MPSILKSISQRQIVQPTIWSAKEYIKNFERKMIYTFDINTIQKGCKIKKGYSTNATIFLHHYTIKYNQVGIRTATAINQILYDT